ncbi:hypothetical protein FJ364_05795 [Candidatus Dependentiae bacterium]|nr:hypothetical protein [Candidatus Dependentiae bacterium]
MVLIRERVFSVVQTSFSGDIGRLVSIVSEKCLLLFNINLTFYLYVKITRENIIKLSALSFMTSLWKSFVTIEKNLAEKLIAAQFPELTPVHLEFLGEGWDNSSFLVNDAIVFRFPRREVAVNLIQHEVNILPYVAPMLPQPVPIPSYLGVPSESYAWPFAGYPLVAGKTSDCFLLTLEERKANIKNLALFLKALHAVKVEPLLERGAPPCDPLDRLNFDKKRGDLLQHLEKIKELELMEVESLVRFTQEFRPQYSSFIPSFVHGDLYARHLLLNESKQLCGIIDWGDMHIGNPAVDLIIVHSFLPPEAHTAFLKYYGAVEESQWLLAKARALYSSALITVYGHDIHDRSLINAGLQGLEFIKAGLL